MSTYTVASLIERMQQRISDGLHKPDDTLFVTIWCCADAPKYFADGKRISEEAWADFADVVDLDMGGSMERVQAEVLKILWDQHHRKT